MSSVSARSTDVRYPRGRATTVGRQLSVDPSALTPVSEATRRRQVVDTTSSTSANIGHHHASCAVSRLTSAAEHPARRCPPWQVRRGRLASTPPTGVTAPSTWTRSNADDTPRPPTVTESRTRRQTPPNDDSSSGALRLTSDHK